MILYPYNVWLSYPVGSSLAFWLAPLNQWILLYYAAGVVAFTFGFFMVLKGLSSVSKVGKGVLLGSLVVFGCYLIYGSYQILIRYFAEEFFSFKYFPWYRLLPVYFMAGFFTFFSGLFIIQKALKTEIHKLTRSAVSAILVITGSFLTYDAYRISTAYYQLKDVVEKYPVPSTVYKDFVGLKTAYEWLPLYIAVALISMGSGLIIAYKAFKTSKTLITS